jgi:putative FmdB family regulatory protein
VPVYQYACTECGEQLEVRQTFTDSALTECPACEGRLRKVLNAVGVVFKGSGFYRNDSRAAAKAESGSAAAAKDGGDSGSKGEATAPSTSDGSPKVNGAPKKESAPAATKSASKTSSAAPATR